MDRDKLVDQLRIHEGVRQYPYKDTVGKITIGVGRNLTDKGMSQGTIDAMLHEDIDEVIEELDNVYPQWCDLSEGRQLVLANMVFNMGMPTVLKFSRFWAALRASEWDKAASEMLESKWADQVGNRAIELSELMRDG